MLKARANNPLPPVVVDLLKTVGFKAWRFQQYHRALPVLKLLVDVSGDEDAAVMLALSQMACGEPLEASLIERVRGHSDAALAATTLARLALYEGHSAR